MPACVFVVWFLLVDHHRYDVQLITSVDVTPTVMQTSAKNSPSGQFGRVCVYLMSLSYL